MYIYIIYIITQLAIYHGQRSKNLRKCGMLDVSPKTLKLLEAIK